jgi:hypothetical protein
VCLVCSQTQRCLIILYIRVYRPDETRMRARVEDEDERRGGRTATLLADCGDCGVSMTPRDRFSVFALTEIFISFSSLSYLILSYLIFLIILILSFLSALIAEADTIADSSSSRNSSSSTSDALAQRRDGATVCLVISGAGCLARRKTEARSA